LDLNFKKLAIQFNPYYWIGKFNQFNLIQFMDIYKFVDLLAPSIYSLRVLNVIIFRNLMPIAILPRKLLKELDKDFERHESKRS